MAIMTIGLLTRGGEDVVNVPEFTFGVGYVEHAQWHDGISTYIPTDYVHVDSNMGNLYNVIQRMTTNTVYDCYLDGIIDERHKMGFSMIKRNRNLTNAIEVAFRCEDTGAYFSARISTDIGVTRSDTCYMVMNDLVSGVDYSNLSITTKTALKRHLSDVKNLYTTKVDPIWTNGMAAYPRAFFTIIQVGGTSYSTNCYNCTQDAQSDRNNSYYVNLHTYWNWYRFLTNEFYFPVQYLKVGDKKIYLSMSVSPIVYDHLIFNYSTDIFEYFDNSAPPVVSYDYQSGTDITQYLNRVGDSLVLDNGSVLRVRMYRDTGTTPNRYYYYYELVNNLGEVITLSSAFNVGAENETLVNQNYTERFNLYDHYYAGWNGNDSSKFMVEGVYLWVTPYEEGGVDYYIDDNRGEPTSFWNKFPTTPVTIGAVVCSYWGLVSKDADGGDTSTATRQQSWKKSNLYMPLLITNIVGYTQNTQYGYTYFKNLFSTLKGDIPQGGGISSLTYGGEIDIDNADNANILLGITSTIDEDEPNHGTGSIGGGSRGTHGGNGSFDDNGDNIGFSLGTSFYSSKALVNWSIGELNSSQFNTFMTALNALISDRNLATRIVLPYEDVMRDIVSLKVVYAPFTPDIGSTYNIGLHNTLIQDADQTVTPAYGQPVNNQYKRDNLKMNYELGEYFGSFLDYAPYTQIKIYLPFAGIFDLNPSDVIGNKLTLAVSIDWITGDLVYTIRVQNESINSILYTFTGNSAVELPLISTDYGTKVQSTVNTMLGAVSMAGGLVASATGAGATIGIPAIIGGATMMGSNALKTIADQGHTVSKGSLGSVAGALSVLKPYLIVTRPKKVEASDYGSILGYPSMQSVKLSSITGYVKIAECHWEIPSATQEEIDELDSLAKSEGMIL